MSRYGKSCFTLLSSVLAIQIAPLWGAAPPQPAGVQPGPAGFQAVAAAQLLAQVNDALDLKASTVQSLAFTQRALDSFSTSVTIDGNPWTLVLKKHSVRSPDFQLLVQNAAGDLIPTEAPPIITYKGFVDEIPGSEVRASYSDGKMNALMYTPNGVYGVQPLADLDLSADEEEHAVYRASDWVNRGNFRCGSDDVAEVFEGFEDQEFDGAEAQRGTGLKITDIGMDADFEFYQLNGSNVGLTMQDMETVMNGVETIYETEAQITYEITVIIVRTAEPDPYTSTDPNVLLTSQFQPHWNSQPQSFIRRDVAHLFTGKNIAGGIIGIAYLNAICNSLSNGYGLSQSRFSGNMASRVALTAHELGHNWSCPHCNDPNCPGYPACCRIMCSGLGGCSGVISSFGTFSANQIIAYRNTRACLSDLADPRTVPFFEDFPNTTLDAAKWIYNFNGVINTNAVNEPSAANSIELDAAGSELYRDDDLRTNFIQLAGLSNVRFSYNTEHRGVEVGEQLVVDYYANNLTWVEINRITSTGVDQSNFVFHTHILPANANHNEFRVRFRPEVSDTGDDWFIDDVTVSTACTSDVDCNDGLHCNGVETCVGTVCLPGVPPSCPGQVCNEALDQCTNCISNASCADALFCNGNETCDGTGNCQPGSFPCTNPATPFCKESADLCVECLVHVDCDDDVFCNGVETCSAGNTCVAGTNPCTASGLACNEDTNACQEPGDMYCVLPSGSAAPGSTSTVYIYLNNVQNDIRSYSTTVAVTQTGGTGTVTVFCPGGTEVDTTRSDYVFLGLPNFPAPNCPARRVSAALTTGSKFVGSTAKYLGTYNLLVSEDAESGSTFDIAITPGGNTYLRDENNLAMTFDILGPCTLTIADCNPCQLYGDVEPPGNGTFVGDCDVDIDDITCVLDGFSNPADCITGDIEPCAADGDIDSDDLLAILGAFTGDSMCPPPCGG